MATVPAIAPLVTAASVRLLQSSFKPPEHCTSAEALALLPKVVLHAMQIAEETGKNGQVKRQIVIDSVSAFYGHAPNAEGDDAKLNPIVAISAEVLTAMVPALIDQIVAVDNGKLVISQAGNGCLAICPLWRICATTVK
jgi:hypothetical protein